MIYVVGHNFEVGSQFNFVLQPETYGRLTIYFRCEKKIYAIFFLNKCIHMKQRNSANKTTALQVKNRLYYIVWKKKFFIDFNYLYCMMVSDFGRLALEARLRDIWKCRGTKVLAVLRARHRRFYQRAASCSDILFQQLTLQKTFCSRSPPIFND